MLTFKLPDAEEAKIEAWINTHRHPGTLDLGRNITYSFTQTGIGVSYTAECTCGDTVDVTNYDEW